MPFSVGAIVGTNKVLTTAPFFCFGFWFWFVFGFFFPKRETVTYMAYHMLSTSLISHVTY